MRKFAPAALSCLASALTGRGRNSRPRSSVSDSTKQKTRFSFRSLSVVAVLVFAPAVMAQSANNRPLPRRTAATTPAYNLANEIAVQGAIQSVVSKPTRGLMYGQHLMVATPQGTVDAQIGKFLLNGRRAPSFTTGQQVRLVGMMNTFHGHAVLLVRLIQTSNETITVRNQRGGIVVPFGKKASVLTSNAGGAL